MYKAELWGELCNRFVVVASKMQYLSSWYIYFLQHTYNSKYSCVLSITHKCAYNNMPTGLIGKQVVVVVLPIIMFNISLQYQSHCQLCCLTTLLQQISRKYINSPAFRICQLSCSSVYNSKKASRSPTNGVCYSIIQKWLKW